MTQPPLLRDKLCQLGVDVADAEQHSQRMEKEGISVEDLSRLGHAELKELGVTKMGDRLKIITGLQDERTPHEQTAVMPPFSFPYCANHLGVPATHQCVQRNCRRNFCIACVSVAPTMHAAGQFFWCHECRDRVKAAALIDCERCALF